MKFTIELDGVPEDISISQALRLIDIDKISLAFSEIPFEDLHINPVKE